MKAMKEDDVRELQARGNTAVGMLTTLQTSLLLSELHRQRGDANGAEAALQTASSALAKLEDHLDFVRGMMEENP